MLKIALKLGRRHARRRTQQRSRWSPGRRGPTGAEGGRGLREPELQASKVAARYPQLSEGLNLPPPHARFHTIKCGRHTEHDLTWGLAYAPGRSNSSPTPASGN